MLCALPAFRALRAAFPAAQITLAGLHWACQFVERFSHYIDHFIAFPGHPQLPEQPYDAQRLAGFIASVSAMRFDLALQLHGSGTISNGIVAGLGARRVAGFVSGDQGEPVHDGERAWLPYPDQGHEAERLLALASFVGAPSTDAELEFPITEQDRHELSRYPCDVRDVCHPPPYVCLHAGARDRAKCWPPAHFARVADQLATESGLAVVLTGSAAEHELAASVAGQMQTPAINAACGMSLGAMAALLSEAQLLICNDTAVSHMAAALKLPSVVIFRRAHIERWAPPDRHRHRVVQDPGANEMDAVLGHARDLLRHYSGGSQCGSACGAFVFRTGIRVGSSR